VILSLFSSSLSITSGATEYETARAGDEEKTIAYPTSNTPFTRH
jgi:hypothetical protein